MALRFAATSPGLVERLILANPPLPARLTVPHWLGWQILGMGRLAVLVGPALARGLVRLWGRRAIDRKLAILQRSAPDRFNGLGGEPSRIPADSVRLWTEQLADLRAHPQELPWCPSRCAA